MRPSYSLSRLHVLAVASSLAAISAFGPASAATDKKASGNPVVATVAGEKIFRSDVELLYQTLPEQYRQMPMQMLFPQLVDRLVDRKLLVKAARDSNVEQDSGFKRQLAFVTDSLLQETYLTRKVDAQLTEKRLRADYEKMIADLPPKEEVRARHILLPTEKEAKAVLAEVKGGADFAETAKAKSTGPSGAQGGDLGYFTKDKMVPEFAAMAFALKPGEIAPAPVKTQFGWHVIKVEDRRQVAAPSFEESVAQLRAAAARNIVVAEVAALRGKAKVKLYNPDGSERKPEAKAAPETAPKTAPKKAKQ